MWRCSLLSHFPYRRIVDTVPPISAANLTSAGISNTPFATVSASCIQEAFPSNCSFCWEVAGTGSANCSAHSPFTIPIAADVSGALSAAVRAVDAAGNAGAPALLSWVQDVAPPDTSASIESRTQYVDALSASVINSSVLSLRVNASEAASSFRVVVFKTDATPSAGGVPVEVRSKVYDGFGDREVVLAIADLLEGSVFLNMYVPPILCWC